MAGLEMTLSLRLGVVSVLYWKTKRMRDKLYDLITFYLSLDITDFKIQLKVVYF